MTLTFRSFTFVYRLSSYCLPSSLEQRAAFRSATGVFKAFLSATRFWVMFRFCTVASVFVASNYLRVLVLFVTSFLSQFCLHGPLGFITWLL